MENQQRLSALGTVVYTESREELPTEELEEKAHDADIFAIDPDNLGGFEKAQERVTKLAETLPNLKGVALSTTAYGWIDTKYFKDRGIPVANVPGYSRESVAEHTVALLLCLAKKILISDRRTQKGQYELELGFELKGKTLGIVGLGNIGSRVAEIAKCFGMRVIAYNPSPRSLTYVEMKTLDKVLTESDAITLHTRDSEDVRGLINNQAIGKMKNGVIIVNTVDPSLVDELDMVLALKSGKVCGYAYEADDLDHTPLASVENALGIKRYAWYTKEALENLFNIWVDNIEGMVKGKLQNIVNN